MEELLEMRQLLEAGRYSEAMLLLDEMDEMAKDDKINKIESYIHILLLHLIKQQAERRTNRSWNFSIRNATRGVLRSLKRRKAGGFYLNKEELTEAVAEIFPEALDAASFEAFGGLYTAQQLAVRVNPDQIYAEALRRILHPADEEDLNETDSDLPQWLK